MAQNRSSLSLKEKANWAYELYKHWQRSNEMRESGLGKLIFSHIFF